MILMAAKDVQPLISDAVGVGIVTGLVGLLTAIVTLVLSNRHARSEAETQRRELRRDEVRRLVSRFVRAGVAYADSFEFLIPVYYKAMGDGDQRFWLEWPDTDSGRKSREDREAITVIAGELRLVVGNAELRSAIDDAVVAVNDGTIMGALMKEAKVNKGVISESGSVMGEAFAHFRELKAAFVKVEDTAGAMLRADI